MSDKRKILDFLYGAERLAPVPQDILNNFEEIARWDFPSPAIKLVHRKHKEVILIISDKENGYLGVFAG